MNTNYSGNRGMNWVLERCDHLTLINEHINIGVAVAFTLKFTFKEDEEAINALSISK